MPVITGGNSALDLVIPGKVGTFRVSTGDGESKGAQVRYLLSHLTLSDTQGQQQLLNMLAPVREVFNLKELEFDELMQRDIDDSRVSMDLIPYLLDTSTAGLVKLFPPIVVVVLPMRPNTMVPDAVYRAVTASETPRPDYGQGIVEHRLTAGSLGLEQFEFSQLFKSGQPIDDGSHLKLSQYNCKLAIVDGQHRAMALLALYRNLSGGWSDARRSPYEEYYKVWSSKAIQKFDLSELQLPMIICTFPDLDGSTNVDIDVVRAARRVFLTLNKSAKKVSDSRNKLLNDQDIVSECLRETLTHIKRLSVEDESGMRLWNVELDQTEDRAKIASEVAFTGVSHIYQIADQLLIAQAPARGIEARNKGGAPKQKMPEAYERLGLKDTLTQAEKLGNRKDNYSDKVASLFRDRWKKLYIPVIDRIYSRLHPFAAFSQATLGLNQELVVNSPNPVLERMFFDSEATSRTFGAFAQTLARKYESNEKNWTTPEIRATLDRVQGVLNSRRASVEALRERRAALYVAGLTGHARDGVLKDNKVLNPYRDALDRIYDTVFTTIAFQTAVVCTYAEAMQESSGGIAASTTASLDEYIDAVNKLLKPSSSKGLANLLSVFEGSLSNDSPPQFLPGSPTFRQVVLPGELQPAEWPKFRYIILELWQPSDPAIAEWVATDRNKARGAVAKSLYQRRLEQYRIEHNKLDLTPEEEHAVLLQSLGYYQEFLKPLVGKVTLPQALLGPSDTGPSTSSAAGESATI